MRWMTAVLSGLLIIGIAGLSFAEEWPHWLGPNRNGISSETGLAASWPESGPKKLWTHTVGIGYSSPVAIDGKVYFFGQENLKDILFAFEADSGKVAWQQAYDRGEDPQYPGTRATPTIESNRIYTYGSGGDLVCRELADGKQVWRTNMLKETNSKLMDWGCTSSPLIDGNHIYVQIGKDGDAIAAAIDKTTGKLVWKSQAKGLASYATLTLISIATQKQLIVFAGKAVIAMDPQTGKTIWTQPWETDYDINAATPVFKDGHLLLSSARANGAMMLNVTAQGAKKEWEKKEPACKYQPPILDGNVLYANSNGVLQCYSWPDFKQNWAASGSAMNLGAGGSIVRVGDKIIAMSERGKLSLIQATPTAYKLLSQTSLFDYSQVWSTPLVYRGKLYAKGENDLVCLDISAKP